jgi:predicted nucleic acid-binding protein
MTELLVQPYRTGNEALVNRYYALLTQYPHLEWVAPDLAVADAAAQIRARYRLRTPDSIQIATAMNAGATAFLSNDADLARVNEVKVAILGNLR